MLSPCPLCHTRDECREHVGGMRVDDIVRAAPDGLTLEAIGAVMGGVTRERIRQIEATALLRFAAGCFGEGFATDAEAEALARWALAQSRSSKRGQFDVVARLWLHERRVDGECERWDQRVAADDDDGDDEGEA